MARGKGVQKLHSGNRQSQEEVKTIVLDIKKIKKNVIRTSHPLAQILGSEESMDEVNQQLLENVESDDDEDFNITRDEDLDESLHP